MHLGIEILPTWHDFHEACYVLLGNNLNSIKFKQITKQMENERFLLTAYCCIQWDLANNKSYGMQ